MRRAATTLVPALAVLASLTAAAAAEFPYYRPQLTNSKDGAVHDFPLGVLSATGRLEHGATAILVKHVGPGGPAELAGLAEGDLIVAVEGKRMPPYSKELDAGLAGPQAVLADALNQGCARPQPQVTLTVLRGEAAQSLVVPLPPSPAFARSFPLRCEKTAAYRRAIYEWLADNQRPDGSWAGGIGGDDRDYLVSFCGLALLSSGDAKYLPHVERCVRFVRQGRIAGINPNDPQAGPKNWIAAAVAIFLAEYYLATGDESVLDDVQKCCDLLAARVAPNGRMGHHREISYNGGGLTIINAQAHLAWALAARSGCRIDAAAWNRSLGEVTKAMTDNGAVGYSSAARGDNDAPARTGAMAAALLVSRQQPALAARMGRWLILRNNRLSHAHTNCSIGLIFGTAGIKTANPQQLGAHLNNWLPYLELSRSAQGAASYFGSKRNFGGDEYLGLAPIANATVGLMLASPESNLFLLGGTKQGWFPKPAATPAGGEDQDAAPPPLPELPAEEDVQDPANAASGPPPAGFRVWTSADGRFQVSARMLRVADGMVHLQREDDGREVAVPLDRLRESDRALLPPR